MRTTKNQRWVREALPCAWTTPGRAWARGVLPLLAAAALQVPAAAAARTDCLAPATTVSAIDLKVLVLAGDGTEGVLPAFQSTLAHLGIPHDVVLTKDQPLNAAMLCDAQNGQGRARYQAVVLTTGALGYRRDDGQYDSGLSLDEWRLLWAFEAKYRLRQASLYTVPGGWPDTYGLTAPVKALDTGATPLQVRPTRPGDVAGTPGATRAQPSGREVFADLPPDAPVTLQGAYTYLAQAVPGAPVTPLLTDAQGHLIASIHRYPDGRQNLALTTDGNRYLTHTLQLYPSIAHWVTQGLYVGERGVYFSAQPDDVMLPNRIWSPQARSDAAGKTYRLTGDDYRQFVAWQEERNRKGPGRIVLDVPFNALGTTSRLTKAQMFPAQTDTLTPAIRANSAAFTWHSHTFSHLHLDAPFSYDQMLSELRLNDQRARELGLANYYTDALVTPEISGLNNPEVLRAMRDFGIRYIVSDTSKHCGHRNTTSPPRPCPEPNMGIYNDLQPEILMVPRYPANLFYNVCTPAEWVSEFNFLYRKQLGRDLDYAEVLERDADAWVRYMLSFDMRPVMFHQANMCAYDGKRSLLSDLIDRTLEKFSALSTLPPESRTLTEIGQLMQERMNLAAALRPARGAPLVAQLLPGAASSRIVLTNPTETAVTMPITGLDAPEAARRRTYGGQVTSRIVVPANGGTVVITGAPAW